MLNTLSIIPILQVSTSPHLFYSTTTYYRSTRRQNPKSHPITTGHHVTTSPYILFSTTTYYRSTGQHVVKTSRTLRIKPIPQVTMSPHHHIAYSLLLPTTGQHVIKTLRIIPVLQVTMSPPRYISYPLAYYYLLQVYMSTRRQNPQNHTSTTGHHVTTSLHLLFSTTTYYRSTGQHIVKTLRFILYCRSTCPHLAIYLILYYYLLQVYRSTRRQNPRKHTSTTGHHVTTSPYILFSTTTYYRSTGQHVFKTLRSIPQLQVTMSAPRHISHSLLLPNTGLQINTSSKP